jgi:hypothetical protein
LFGLAVVFLGMEGTFDFDYNDTDEILDIHGFLSLTGYID